MSAAPTSRWRELRASVSSRGPAAALAQAVGEAQHRREPLASLDGAHAKRLEIGDQPIDAADVVRAAGRELVGELGADRPAQGAPQSVLIGKEGRVARRLLEQPPPG